MMVNLEVKNCNMVLPESSKNISIIICEIDKHEYLTGEEILPSNQRQIIE